MATNNFSIHLHFATSFALTALSNLNNAEYDCALATGGLKRNAAWARENLERAIKALDAFEKERANPGTEVDADYLPGVDEPESEPEANHAFSGSF